MPSKSDYNESIRWEYLSGSGLLGPVLTRENLRDARFFINTLEKYLDEAERKEVAALETAAKHLSEEEKDEYWQWRYPIHWQDVFGVRIRSAFCAQLCSHLEAVMGDLCRRVQTIGRSVIRVSDLRDRKSVV